MKKFLAAGMLAICVIAVSQQQASAWKNSSFSFGMQWSHSSGNNSFCHGAWRNGQVPGPEAFHHGHYPQPFQYFAQMESMPSFTPMAAPAPTPYYPQTYQFATYPQPQQTYTPAPYYYYYGR